MFYYIDPYTVPTVLINDLTSTTLPAFSQVNGTPWLLTCSTPCGEDVTIHAEAPGGTHIGQGVGITQDQTYTSGTPAHFIH